MNILFYAILIIKLIFSICLSSCVIIIKQRIEYAVVTFLENCSSILIFRSRVGLDLQTFKYRCLVYFPNLKLIPLDICNFLNNSYNVCYYCKSDISDKLLLNASTLDSFSYLSFSCCIILEKKPLSSKQAWCDGNSSKKLPYASSHPTLSYSIGGNYFLAFSEITFCTAYCNGI